MKPLTDYEPLVRSIVSRIVQRQSVTDELVQETFLRALEARPEERDSLAPWLARVARNLAIDVVREERRLTGEPHDPSDARPDPGEAIPLRSLLPRLGALSPTEAVVILLRDVLDLSVDEVAAVTGSPSGSVRVLHHRARVRARQAEPSPDDGVLAAERFLGWLVIHPPTDHPLTSWHIGVLSAYRTLVAAMVEVAVEAGRPDIEYQVRMLRAIGHVDLGEDELGMADLRAAVTLASEHGSDGQRGYAECRLAQLHLVRGELAHARAYALAALPRMHRSTRRDAEIRALLRTVLAETAPDAAEASRWIAESRDEASRDDLPSVRPITLLAVALEHLHAERFEEAEAALLASLAEIRSLGQVRNEAAACINLAMCAFDLGDPAAGSRWMAQALGPATRFGDPKILDMVEAVRAVHALLEGRLDDAMVSFERIRSLTGANAADATYHKGVAHHLRGELSAAVATLGLAVALAPRSHLPAAHLAAAAAEAEVTVPHSAPEGEPLASQVRAMGLLRCVGELDTAEGRARARDLLAEAPDRPLGLRLARDVLRSALERRSAGPESGR